MEQEFWRILSLPEGSVTVEYGADLPTGELGSGFPSLKTHDLTENDKVDRRPSIVRRDERIVSPFRNISIHLGISIISPVITNLS